MKKVCVYGSLREGEYNFDRFKQYYGDNIKSIGSYIIEGFDLYNLGSYPGVKLSINNKQPLTVDILECSEECFNGINRMELGAGYHAHNITIDDNDCVIYIYDGYAVRHVEHGDWSKYLKEKLEKKDNAEYIQ